MTVLEVLEQDRNTLSNISIPAALVQELGLPVAGVINDLGAVIRTLKKSEKQAQPEAQEARTE